MRNIAFKYLLEDIYGDKSQCLSLYLCYFQLELESTKSTISKNEELLSECVDFKLSDEKLSKVVKHIDQVFTKVIIKKCYSSFCEINEPIVSHKEVFDMTNYYSTNPPDHYNIMHTSMFISQKDKKERNQHLADQHFYKKLFFY